MGNSCCNTGGATTTTPAGCTYCLNTAGTNTNTTNACCPATVDANTTGAKCAQPASGSCTSSGDMCNCGNSLGMPTVFIVVIVIILVIAGFIAYRYLLLRAVCEGRVKCKSGTKLARCEGIVKTSGDYGVSLFERDKSYD